MLPLTIRGVGGRGYHGDHTNLLSYLKRLRAARCARARRRGGGHGRGLARMTSVTIDLSGKVALVTGGAYGMGRAAARRFASCGARVAVADVDVARGLETVEMITKAGGRALFIEADV